MRQNVLALALRDEVRQIVIHSGRKGGIDVDSASRMMDRAIKLAGRVDLKARLARFQIDGSTKSNLGQLKLPTTDGLDSIVARFYEYLHHFPETHELLKGHDEERLRVRQKAHWMQLLRCDFDQNYVHSCLVVGLQHFHARVPPQTYIAAYSYFQSELLRKIMSMHTPMEFEALSISVGKVIMLDMSISLNAYMLDAMAMKM